MNNKASSPVLASSDFEVIPRGLCQFSHPLWYFPAYVLRHLPYSLHNWCNMQQFSDQVLIIIATKPDTCIKVLFDIRDMINCFLCTISVTFFFNLIFHVHTQQVKPNSHTIFGTRGEISQKVFISSFDASASIKRTSAPASAKAFDLHSDSSSEIA